MRATSSFAQRAKKKTLLFDGMNRIFMLQTKGNKLNKGGILHKHTEKRDKKRQLVTPICPPVRQNSISHFFLYPSVRNFLCTFFCLFALSLRSIDVRGQKKFGKTDEGIGERGCFFFAARSRQIKRKLRLTH